MLTRDQHLFHYNPTEQKLKQYILPIKGNLHSLLIDPQNNVWLTGFDGTFILNRGSDLFESWTHENEIVQGITFYEDALHNIWIGMRKKGLLRMDRSRNRNVIMPFPKQNDIELNYIHVITEYSPGILLLGSNSGLTLFNTVSGEYKHYASKDESSTSLSDKFVYSILKDNEGGIWIGTFYGGINYIPPYCGQFEGYTRSLQPNSLTGKIISRFCEGANCVWIASDDGGELLFTERAPLYRLSG